MQTDDMDFILSIASGEHLAYFKEALTYDIYLRENAKSRPDFAPDLQEYKNVITDFYREEAEKHRFLPESSQYDARQLQRMTHLEVLQYPVFSKEKMTELKNGLWEKEESYFVLFDYASRNPLTYEARVVVLPLNNGR